MLDPARLSIHQVTVLQQCSTPEFVAALTRNDVACASVWRAKIAPGKELGSSKFRKVIR